MNIETIMLRGRPPLKINPRDEYYVCYCNESVILDPMQRYMFKMGFYCKLPSNTGVILTNYVSNLDKFEVSSVRYSNDQTDEYLCCVTNVNDTLLMICAEDVLCVLSFVSNIPITFTIVTKKYDERDMYSSDEDDLIFLKRKKPLCCSLTASKFKFLKRK